MDLGVSFTIMLLSQFITHFLSGLSLYQGGPAMYLNEWNGEGEHYAQFRAGLKRTGLDQVCRINFSHN